MTTLNATQPDTSRQHTMIDVKLRRAWRKERRYQHYRAACQIALWVVSLLVLTFVLDWQLRLPWYGRLMLLGFNVGVLGWSIWHYWLRHLRQFDPVRVALQVESHNPELESLLVSFVQLRQEQGDDAHISPSLLNAMRQQAIEVTGPIDFKRIINYAQLKRILIVSLAAVLFFTGISVNWNDYFKALVVRMINPAANVQYPTRTNITNVSGDLVVQQGERVVIDVAAEGMVPQEGRLHVRPIDGDWERLPLLQQEPNQFAARFTDVYQSFDYWVKLGDDRTEKFRVTVVPPPQIVGTKVIATYPSYTGTASAEKNVLNITVPEGTQLQWELTLDRPLSKGAIMPDSPGLMIGDETAGGILAEVWTGIKGSAITDLTKHARFKHVPNHTQVAKRFELPKSYGDNYGSRLRGFVIPPRTGRYRFYLNSDDQGQLWLSPSADPRSKQLIAKTSAHRTKGDFTSTEEQQSKPVTLRAGRRYYIEALMKEGIGDDHVAVAWKGPGIRKREVIQGKYLRPWEGEGAAHRPTYDMQLDDTGTTVRIIGKADASFGYQFRWVEREHNYTYDEEVQYFVTVTPDAPPQVELAHPSEDIKATIRKTLNLTFRANDDYGIAKAWLVWQLNESQEQRLELNTYAKPVIEDTIPLRLTSIAPGIQVGDTLTYSVEVADNRSGEPHLVRSAVRNMYVVSVAEYQQYIFERMNDMAREVKDVRDVEVDGRKEVDSILKHGAPAPGGTR